MLMFVADSFASDYGSLFFHGNCITCHHETKAISAPSIIQVRERYISAFEKKEDFISYMSEWILKPDATTSLMNDAIKEYKIMPLLGNDIQTLREIAEFIYETDFNKKHKHHDYGK